jgi:DNA-binding NarL/FixJ family response regulator
MQFLSSSYVDANLPYLTLLIGVVACLMLYLGLGHQMQKLRAALLAQRRRVESLEKELGMAGVGTEQRDGGKQSRPAAAPDTTRQKVIQLHSQGRSSGEIAEQAGLREAEVDFLLRVHEHMEAPGRALALRKIS